MKKLLFGLLLTIGVSGFSFGNTIIEKGDLDLEEQVYGCSYATIQTVYYCDGTSMNYTHSQSSGACGNHEEGSIVITVMRAVHQICD